MEHVTSINRMALTATVHCFTGCAIGEVLGLVVANALGLGALPSILLAIGFAFAFGYALTIVPLLRAGMPSARAFRLAFLADTASVGVMEVVDNTVIAAIPGAMIAGLAEPRFWWTLALGLAVAFAVALPVNRWLIARDRGHALVHGGKSAEAARSGREGREESRPRQRPYMRPGSGA